MYIFLTILAEFFFVLCLIILMYRLKPTYGLIPLYILMGSIQFFQTILSTSFYINFFGALSISPGSVILFGASLFAILLIYIKEGVLVTQRLILGIVLANISFSILSWITNLQLEVTGGIIHSSGFVPDFFNINIRAFFTGTITLILDAILLVVLYDYFRTRQKKMHLFIRLLLVMLVILNFDALVFVTGSFGGNAGWTNILISQVIGKSVAAILYAAGLFVYIRFIDKNKTEYSLTGEYKKDDIFSILTYREKYEKLKSEKEISDEQLQKVISEKTTELENSIKRFTILSDVRELRIDKFSSSERAREYLKKIKEAFEIDACIIYLLRDTKLIMLSAVGLNSHEEAEVQEISTTTFKEIIEKKKPLAIEDTGKDPGIKAGNSHFKYISCLGTALISGDKVEGIIKIYSRSQKRIFTRIEKEQFQLVASHIADVIKNTQLFEQNEKHKEVLVKQIIARKKVEENIVKSEEKYRTLVERVSDAFVALDKNWVYTYVNKKAGEIFGRKPEELIGKNIWDEFPEGVNQPFYDAYMKAIKDQIPSSIMEYYPPYDKWFENDIYPSPDGLTIYFKDITDKRKAETEKQFLLKRNQQTINSMLDGFILADEQGNIIEVNPAYCNMVGYSWEELLKKNINEIEATLSSQEVDSRIAEIKEKKSVKFETKHRRKDNVLIDLEVSISIMLFANQPLLAAFVRDITERKKTLEQIKMYNEQLRLLTAHLQNIREEERNRIGREIHDDLGQQLTAIKMDVAWIDKKIPDTAELVKEKLSNINQLLDGSNLSVRRILSELRPSILDEYGLLYALEWHSKQFFANTGIPVEIVSATTKIRLPEDIATCIFRIFQESLTNISRHANATKVLTNLSISSDTIIVNIQDNGIGFDIDKVENFKSFGILGMQERVKSLNGNFELLSAIGKGTKISITLPYKN